MLTMQPTLPCTTAARGAEASQLFIEPHSSASTWPKPIQRTESRGMTRAAASDTRGNKPRIPVWNSSGSLPPTRYWLSEKFISAR